MNTPYDIKFRVDKENVILCSKELNEKDLKKFRKAVKKDYYFQVFWWCWRAPPGSRCRVSFAALRLQGNQPEGLSLDSM